tara:strand:+ start:160 stop:351 length:192 start_codon:yes stop_codon:yes gene_type:complete
MPAKNRTSISLSDETIVELEFIASRLQRSKAEVIRIIIREFLDQNPDRFNLAKRLSERTPETE